MDLSDDISKLLIQLLFKVLTPIMVFILAIFGGTIFFIFKAHSVSATFNFDVAVWVWLIVCLGFTPLCGAIMWNQSVKAVGGARKKKKRTTPAKKGQEATP